MLKNWHSEYICDALCNCGRVYFPVTEHLEQLFSSVLSKWCVCSAFIVFLVYHSSTTLRNKTGVRRSTWFRSRDNCRKSKIWVHSPPSDCSCSTHLTNALAQISGLSTSRTSQTEGNDEIQSNFQRIEVDWWLGGGFLANAIPSEIR